MASPGDRFAARVSVALLITTTLWAVAVVTAPWLAMSAKPGSPAVFASAAVYGVGAIVCHQRPERSFHTGGIRWPVCARCAGLYVSAGATAALVLLTAPRRPQAPIGRTRLVPVALIASAPTVISWLGERVHVVAPDNALRATLAAPLGCAVAALLALAWRTAGERGN